VDQVYFGKTLRGFTFTYDTSSAAVVQSQLGLCGAFQAVMCGDIGSPGQPPCDPVPLRITQQPVSQTVDAGGVAAFRVEANGLPRPVVSNGSSRTPPSRVSPPAGGQPRRGGRPRGGILRQLRMAWKSGSKPGELVIPNVQPSHAGQYFVVFSNGLERLTSAVVTLTINTNPTPPRVECPDPESRWPALGCQPRTNLVVAPWQTAYFEVLVGGIRRRSSAGVIARTGRFGPICPGRPTTRW